MTEPSVSNGHDKPKPSMAIMRQVFAHLDDVFDVKTHFYKPGWNDVRVAKACGTTEEIVVQGRIEGGYGELAEDKRLTVLRDDIELMKMEVSEFGRALYPKLEALTNRLEQLTAQTRR